MLMYQRKYKILTFFFIFTSVVTANMMPSTTASWSIHETRLTTFPYFDAHPSITQTSDGRIWIIWAQETLENFTLTYTISSDLGATWSNEMNLTKILGEGDDTCPSIIQTANGTIWVVWQSNRPPPPPPPLPDFSISASPPSLTIPQSNSDTSNITVTSLNDFSEPVDLLVSGAPPDVTATLDPPQVTPPPNGTANSTLTVTVGATATLGNYMLTVSGRAQGGLRHSVDIALEIIELGTLGYGASGLSSFASPSPTIYDQEIYYKTSPDYGETWSNATQLTNNLIDDVSPSIVQLMNGTILVVWQSTRTGNNDIFCRKSPDGGASWSSETPITTDANEDRNPSVTQMEDGRIWVVWHSNRLGDNEVLGKVYDGLSWSDYMRLTTNAQDDTNPSILQTIDGTLWLFWSSPPSVNARNDLYYKTLLNNGDTWSERVQFTTDPYDDIWSSITQTNDTKIWVLWVSDRADQPWGNWDIYYRTTLAGDINDDGAVDINDLAILDDAYGFTPGNPGWDATTDINKDDVIDIYDLAIVGRNYGAT